MTELNIKTMSYKITDAGHYDNRFRMRDNLTTTLATSAAAAVAAHAIPSLASKLPKNLVGAVNPSFLKQEQVQTQQPQSQQQQQQQPQSQQQQSQQLQSTQQQQNCLQTNYGNKLIIHNAPTRCGEIFVTRNANRWTFKCTLCQKSTRDIGVFIIHIQKKHLNSLSICTDPLSEFDDDDHNFAPHKGGKFPTDNMVVDLIEVDDEVNFNNRHHSSLGHHSIKNQEMFDNNSTADGENFVGNNGSLHHHNDRKQNSFFCSFCNKTFQFYSLYRNHMDKHINEYPNRCHFCNRGFKSKQALRYHVTTHERDRRFQCKMCTKTFTIENQFVDHMQTHSSSTCYPCKTCGQVFPTDLEREDHQYEHNEERPYACEHCNKQFRKRHHLSNHLKLHRQYRCDYCHAEFNSLIQLSKPYACTTCTEKTGGQPFPTITTSNIPNTLAGNSSGGGGGAGGGSNTNTTNNSTDNEPQLAFYHFMHPQPQPQTTTSANSQHTNTSTNANTNPNNTNANPHNVLELLTGGKDRNDNQQQTQQQNQPHPQQANQQSQPLNPNNPQHNQLAQQQQQQQQQQQAEDPSQNRFKCDYCELSYATVNALNYHVRNKHY